MMRWPGAIALLSASALWAAGAEPDRLPIGQGPEPTSLTTVSHVGIMVRDANKSAAAWQELLGANIGSPRRVGKNATAIDARLENLPIELLQPDTGSSPWRTFLDLNGEGVHHVAFETANPLATADRLEKIGGRKHNGADPPLMLVEFEQDLGGAIELVKPPSQRAAALTHADAQSRVVAIGHLTRDEERARAFWGRVLGVEIPPARDTKGVPFPSDCQCDRNAYIREVNIRLPAIGINLIQPVGGTSVWRRMIDRHEGIGYLQFNLPSQQALDARIALLLRSGGRRTIGETGAPYAYIDLLDRLGITLLLVRSAAQ